MSRWLPSLLLVALAGCAPALSDVKPRLADGDRGTIWFRTDEPLVLSGELRFPDGPGPFPAVVLMHGCSGLPSRSVSGWEPVLREWGLATFVVDSFGNRGLREVCTRGGLRSTDRIPDAYAALRILATHPRIDARRVVLMGFSHGGLATLASATTWSRERFTVAGGPAFLAFFPFYPYCNGRSEQPLALAGPVHIHTGELDDWTPAAPCVRLAAEARAAGVDVEITVYEGAAHGFDSIGTAVQRLPDVLNGAACFPRVATVMGPVLNEEELRACTRRGATVGWNPEATERARRNVKARLDGLLR